MHPVDALLEQARHLLGTQAPPSMPAATYSPATPVGEWTGQAGDQSAPAALTEQLHTLRDRHTEAAAITETANAIAEHAHSTLTAIQSAWEHDKAALHAADTPDAQAALLQTAQQHIDEATKLVEDTATQYQDCAQQLRAVAEDS